MSLGSFLKKQFIDVIAWTEDGAGTLQYRYPMQDMEIQNGGQLTVRESQMAVFVNEGVFADVFSPGLYTLNTKTLPLLTNLRNWDKLFQSPFKSDVYFYSTRQQTNQRWGTPMPVTIRDKDFGAVRLRANGIYSYHLTDPPSSIRRSRRRRTCTAPASWNRISATRSSARSPTRSRRARSHSSIWPRTSRNSRRACARK